MKKILLIIILFSLSSCWNDDNEINNNEQTNTGVENVETFQEEEMTSESFTDEELVVLRNELIENIKQEKEFAETHKEEIAEQIRIEKVFLEKEVEKEAMILSEYEKEEKRILNIEKQKEILMEKELKQEEAKQKADFQKELERIDKIEKEKLKNF